MTIGILGGGVWGSALAKLFSDQEVLIYTRDKKVMNSINDHHFNPKLKYAIFNENVKATDDLDEIAKKNSKLVFSERKVFNKEIDGLLKKKLKPTIQNKNWTQKNLSTSISVNPIVISIKSILQIILNVMKLLKIVQKL